MAATAQKLTYDEFTAIYGDKTHEYWYGEAVPKGMPSWVHGMLQQIIAQELRDRGLFAGSEVELRIDPEARPRPDVVALRTRPEEKYPTFGPDVVVEIISEDDKVHIIREHCRKYEAWGCQQIYLVDPGDRSVGRWEHGSQIACEELAGIPVAQIWEQLDKQFKTGA